MEHGYQGTRGLESQTRGNQNPDPDLKPNAERKRNSIRCKYRLQTARRVELACREHSCHRNWLLHAVNARSNHVHVVVSAYSQTADDSRPIEG